MSWGDDAEVLLREYAHRTNKFSCAQAFRYAYEHGLPVAKNPNQLGPVFRRCLILTGMVRFSGMVPSDEPRAKKRLVALYESVMCSYFDGGNSDQVQLAALVTLLRERAIDATTLAQRAYELGRNGKLS